MPAGSPKKTPPLFSGGVFYDRVCKPGSVIDSHLSRRTVAGALQPPSRKQPGRPCLLCGVAPDRVYSNGRFHTPLGALLPHLSTLAGGGASRLRRFISVALFLRSLWAGVTRYPCPAEPGLSSWTTFRPVHAAVCFPRGIYCTGRPSKSQRGKFHRIWMHCPRGTFSVAFT